MKGLTKLFEVWGPLIGWIVAVCQLGVWAGILLTAVWRKHRIAKERKNMQEEVLMWQEEAARAKDLADGWFQTTKQALMMMRKDAPRVCRAFMASYGGKKAFKSMWQLPEISSDQSEDRAIHQR